MSFKSSEEIKTMCDEHWSYIEKGLKLSGIEIDVLKHIEFHYKTAMYHGYKHAMEDSNVKIDCNNL